MKHCGKKGSLQYNFPNKLHPCQTWVQYSTSSLKRITILQLLILLIFTLSYIGKRNDLIFPFNSLTREFYMKMETYFFFLSFFCEPSPKWDKHQLKLFPASLYDYVFVGFAKTFVRIFFFFFFHWLCYCNSGIFELEYAFLHVTVVNILLANEKNEKMATVCPCQTAHNKNPFE